MSRRTTISLILLGPTVLCVLVFAPTARKDRIPSNSATGNTMPLARDYSPGSSAVIPAVGSSKGTTVRSRVAVQPDWQKLPAVQQILAGSDPRARILFEDGLGYIMSGNFNEALWALNTLIRSYPDDKAIALANWAKGLAYYREGGKDNLHAAYVQFDKFAGSYGSDKDLDELVQVAQLDMAAIQLELARSASIDIAKLATAMAAKGSDPVTEGQLIQSQIDLVNAEALAFQTLTLFFQAYPDSPYAQAAGLFLQEVWSFVGTTQ